MKKQDPRSGKETKQRIDDIRRSLERSDATRRGHLYPGVNIARRRRLDIFSRYDSKFLRRDTLEASAEIKSKRLTLAVKIANILQIVTIPYFGFLMGSALLRLKLQEPWNVVYSPLIILPMFGMATAFLVLRDYVDRKVRRYVDQRAKEGSGRDKHLKETTQHFINKLASQVAQDKEDPARFKFKIFYDDYKGIRIVSRPGIIRRHYVAAVAIGNSESEKPSRKQATT